MLFRLLAQRNPVDAAASHSRISLFRYMATLVPFLPCCVVHFLSRQ
jgi:hypothetical protein